MNLKCTFFKREVLGHFEMSTIWEFLKIMANYMGYTIEYSLINKREFCFLTS